MLQLNDQRNLLGLSHQREINGMDRSPRTAMQQHAPLRNRESTPDYDQLYRSQMQSHNIPDERYAGRDRPRLNDIDSDILRQHDRKSESGIPENRQSHRLSGLAVGGVDPFERRTDTRTLRQPDDMRGRMAGDFGIDGKSLKQTDIAAGRRDVIGDYRVEPNRGIDEHMTRKRDLKMDGKPIDMTTKKDGKSSAVLDDGRRNIDDRRYGDDLRSQLTRDQLMKGTHDLDFRRKNTADQHSEALKQGLKVPLAAEGRRPSPRDEDLAHRLKLDREDDIMRRQEVMTRKDDPRQTALRETGSAMPRSAAEEIRRQDAEKLRTAQLMADYERQRALLVTGHASSPRDDLRKSLLRSGLEQDILGERKNVTFHTARDFDLYGNDEMLMERLSPRSLARMKNELAVEQSLRDSRGQKMAGNGDIALSRTTAMNDKTNKDLLAKELDSRYVKSEKKPSDVRAGGVIPLTKQKENIANDRYSMKEDKQLSDIAKLKQDLLRDKAKLDKDFQQKSGDKSKDHHVQLAARSGNDSRLRESNPFHELEKSRLHDPLNRDPRYSPQLGHPSDDRHSVRHETTRGSTSRLDRYGNLLADEEATRNLTRTDGILSHKRPSLFGNDEVDNVDRRLQQQQQQHRRVKFDESTLKRNGKYPQLKADLSGTKYELVHDIAQRLGFALCEPKDRSCSLIWNDAFVSMEKIGALQPHQRINHFTGMAEIAKKDRFVRNMSKMVATHPQDYVFVPKSWILPDDLNTFQLHCKELKKKGVDRSYILKPFGENKSGLRLCLTEEECIARCTGQPPCVVQEYIDKPLLVGGFKSHLRLYALITSIDPLRVFVYKDGMLYMSSVKYLAPAEGNLDNLAMHITTEIPEEKLDEVDGTRKAEHQKLFDGKPKQSKFPFRSLLEQLDNSDASDLWHALIDLVVKTVLVVQPHLYESYNLCRVGKKAASPPPAAPSAKHRQHRPTAPADSVCFEILAFDILIDRTLRPFLLEVNRSPSFAVEYADNVDYDLKAGVIEDAIRLLNIRLRDTDSATEAQKSLDALNQLALADTEAESTAKPPNAAAQPSDAQKEHLAEMMRRLKADAGAQTFAEDCGRFKQVFPPPDKSLTERYLKVLETSCNIYEPQLADEQKQEVKRFLIQKEKESIESVVYKHKNKVPGKETLKEILKIDEKLASKTLVALNNARIAYPGKSEQAAERILDKIHEKWKLHKPQVAAYWLVHLDSNKQNKLLDVVRNKVCEVLQKTWKQISVENSVLYRAFNRVFNRMLSNHGQGLWDCLLNNSSWELIFRTRTESVTETELACCRRVVQLCCDCLLIVYCCATNAMTLKPPQVQLPWERRSMSASSLHRMVHSVV